MLCKHRRTCMHKEKHSDAHTFFYKTNNSNMSNKVLPSLLTLPIELVYCILDNLDQLTILLSLRNVCIKLNAIIDTYHRYQVNFIFAFK